jgi:serine protease Do
MIPTKHGLTTDLPLKNGKKTEARLIPAVIVLSFLISIGGSLFTSLYIVPIYQNRNLDDVKSGEVNIIQVNEESAVVDVVKRASPAVVSIIISKDLNKVPGFSSDAFDFSPFSFDPFFQFQNPGESSESNVQIVGRGSGFIISSKGLIVTNKHVVDDASASYTVLTNEGKSFDAKVLSVDPVNDLALVKIDGEDLPTVSLGNSEDLEIGQRVIAIGNSLGHRNTVTTGVVSGIGRSITASGSFGFEQLEGVIQTDAAINPGNSGGPLLDIGGSVIGINTAIDSQGQLIGFAIPVEDIKKDIESFEKFGRIVKPFLGVRYVLVNETIQKEKDLKVDYGALIIGGVGNNANAVVAGSAADKAGLKENDVILEVNDKRIDRNLSLAGVLKNFDPGDVVRMKIFSDDQEKQITVTLGETK